MHRDVPVDVPQSIDEFARRHPQRLQLVDIQFLTIEQISVIKSMPVHHNNVSAL